MARALLLPAAPAAEEEFVRADQVDVEAVRVACRSLVRRRALVAASVSFLPVPGVDFITDVAVLVKLLPQINARFGLAEAQVEHLSPQRKVLAYRLMVSAGGMLARRVTTTLLVTGVLRRAGTRLGAMEATRLVPLIGQGVAAAIAFYALTRIAGRHIDQCAEIARQLRAESGRSHSSSTGS